MKTILTIFVFICCFGFVTHAFSQEFGGTGSEWYYDGHNAAPPEYSGYIRFKNMGDTIVGNKLTHKLVQSNYNYEGELVYETEHYVFQESDTVFLYSIPKSDFLVFYIFNRNQGDTITLDAPYTIPGLGSKYRLVIDSVSTVVIDNTPLQKYKTSALDEYSLQGQGYFMDRIGGLTWFSPTPITGIPEGPGPIRCYSDLQVDTNFQTYN